MVKKKKKEEGERETQHNGISQPTDLPIYSKTKNLLKAGIFI